MKRQISPAHWRETFMEMDGTLELYSKLETWQLNF